jgi:hypothetical protein
MGWRGCFMRKILAVILVVSAALVFLFPHEGKCLIKENLYDRLSDAKEVKTYVAGITDSSGQAGDILISLKKRIEDALVARMTINFVLVPSKDYADIVITCDITERIWMKEEVRQPWTLLWSRITPACRRFLR